MGVPIQVQFHDWIMSGLVFLFLFCGNQGFSYLLQWKNREEAGSDMTKIEFAPNKETEVFEECLRGIFPLWCLILYSNVFCCKLDSYWYKMTV